MAEKIKKIQVSCFGAFNVVIFLAFFFAKIFDKIDWSWWWIFSPLWIPIAVVMGIITIIGLVYLGALIIGVILSWK